MEKISASQAAKLLGISVDKVEILEKQGLIHSTVNTEGISSYSAEEIARIKSRPVPTLAEEAAQVGAQIQQEVFTGVSSLLRSRKTYTILGAVVFSCLVLSFIILSILFYKYPLQMSDYFGYYYRFNSAKQQASLSSEKEGNVLAASTGPSVVSTQTTILADIIKPVAAMSLVAVKAVDSQKYTQIVTNPAEASVLNAPTGTSLPGINGTNGANGVDGQPGLTGAQGLTGPSGSNGTNGSNGSNGTSVADILTTPGSLIIRDGTNTTVPLSAGSNGQVLTISSGIPAWENSSTTVTNFSGSLLGDVTGTQGATVLKNTGTAGTYGSALSIPVLTTDAQGRVSGVTNTAISGLTTSNFGSANISQWTNNSGYLTSEADTLSSVTGRGATTATALTLSNVANSITAGTLTATGGTINGTTIGVSSPSTGVFTTINGLTITNNGTNTLNIIAGKTLSVNNSITFGGTDGTTFALPATNDTLVSRTSTDALTNKTISAGSNTISGLTNSNLSGSAGITNANLANSSIAISGNSGSGSVSLGGGLTFTGSGITNIVASGSTLTVTSTEVDTLASVTGRGASTSLGLTLNGGVTTTTSTALTLDSGTTGAVNIGNGVNAKTVTIGNNTGATAVNINSGTGNVNFTVDGTGSSGKVQIGNSGTATPDLLVLDNGTADPTGVNGGMYYNSSTGKFRCFQNSAWTNCITPPASDSQHAASYDTNEALTNIPGSTQVVLGTVSITPTSATGDVYVTGFAEVRSSNNTDQPFTLVIETTSNCTGSTVGNASVTYTITTNTSTTTHLGNIRVSGIAVDPGASVQPYSLCASVSAGDTDVLNWGVEALVIDTGADLAEIYTTNDESIEVGDVVSLDSNLQTGMKKSQKGYDQSVLGIVSTRPGLVIGGVDKEGVNAMPVALSGRVRVKVSSQNGPIYAGDYLTSSSIPGVAMKATKAGAIIGTAMTSFDGEGIGQVLVFVKNGSSMGSNDILTQLLSDPDSQLLENSASSSAEPAKAKGTIETNLIGYITQIVSDFFKKTVEFFGTVIFHTDVAFLGRPTFNKDTAGHALIKQGESEVSVIFEKEYAQNPVVTANVNLVGGVKADEIPMYAVYDLGAKGFKIKLSKSTPFDLNFSWIALFVNDDNKSSHSILETPVLSPIPTVIPSTTSSPSPEIVPSQTATESASPSAEPLP